MEGSLPAHIEVSGLIRAVEAAGGFATVIQRGERDAGVILILTMERGVNARLWERMPQLDGSRSFQITEEQETDNKDKIYNYVERRRHSDPDCWLIELDIAQPERFIAETTAAG